MRTFRAYAIVAVMAILATNAASSENTRVIGVNQHLSDGARALQMGDYDSGIRLTLAGLKAQPMHRERASALNNLCAGYVAVREFDEAITQCSQAIEIDGKNWRMFNNRALAYLGKGQIAAAMRDAKTGLALNPDGRNLIKVQTMIKEQGPRVLLAGADR